MNSSAPGKARGADRVLQRQARTAGQDVVADRAAEQEVVLQHDTETGPQMPQIDFPQIGAVDLHEPRIFAVDALQQPGDGGFAGSRPSHEAQHGAGGDRERDLLQRRNLGAGIGEGHVLEADRAGELRPQSAGGGVDLQRPVQHVGGLRHGAADFFPFLDQPRQADQRLTDALRQHHEGEQAADLKPGRRRSAPDRRRPE